MAEGFAEAQRLGGTTHGTSPLSEEDSNRKRQLEAAKANLWEANKLRQDIDHNVVTWDDLTTEEQELLCAYDAGKLGKACDAHKKSRLDGWRS